MNDTLTGDIVFCRYDGEINDHMTELLRYSVAQDTESQEERETEGYRLLHTRGKASHRGGCIPRGVIHGGKQALGVARRLSGGFGLLRGCRGSSFRCGHGRLRLGGVRLLIVAGHPEKACSCTQYDQHHHQGNYRVAAAALFFYLLAVVVIISHRVIFSFYQQPRRAGGQKQQI